MRMIILECGTDWRIEVGSVLVTMFQEKWVLITWILKNTVPILFFKGALLHDAKGILMHTNGECASGTPDPVHQWLEK